MSYCTDYFSKTPDTNGWMEALASLKAVNDEGARKAVADAALPTAREIYQEAVKTEKGREDIGYCGGAKAVKVEVTGFILRSPF